jgi:hypothetical protein
MPNILDDIIPKILSGALQSLRESCIMPRLVNGDYSADARQKGDRINVTIPTTIAPVDVVPANIAPNPPDLIATTTPIVLDNWKEAAFYLTDRDQLSIMEGYTPLQVSEAGKTIANAIDSSLLNLYKFSYLFTGTAGTTPFDSAAGTTSAQNARRLLNRAACPPQNRRMVLDVDADANATGLPQFQSADRAATDMTITEGMIGRKLGFDFYYDQLMPRHAPVRTAPTGWLVNGQYAAGVNTINIDTGAGTIVEGDLFTIAGNTQSYVVRSSTATSVTFLPKTPVAIADNSAITFVANHAVNLGFHRDAIGMAVRSLQNSELELALGGRAMVMVDPVSQIPLRLEVTREYKRVRWSIDCLWGVGAVRPECMVRLVG